jgi:hypothetical protein
MARDRRFAFWLLLILMLGPSLFFTACDRISRRGKKIWLSPITRWALVIFLAGPGIMTCAQISANLFYSRWWWLSLPLIPLSVTVLGSCVLILEMWAFVEVTVFARDLRIWWLACLVGVGALVVALILEGPTGMYCATAGATSWTCWFLGLVYWARDWSLHGVHFRRA